MKIIIYPLPDGSVEILYPAEQPFILTEGQFEFINANCADKLNKENGAIPVMTSLTIAQRDCLNGRVLITEDGIIDGYPAPAGSTARRYDAYRCGVKHAPITMQVADYSNFDKDRTFRAAWRVDSTSTFKRKVDISAAKLIAHEARRGLRQELLTPLDEMAKEPSRAAEAEALKVPIRAADATRQTKIDAAKTPAAIKKALGL